jgi:hypothetical protein
LGVHKTQAVDIGRIDVSELFVSARSLDDDLENNRQILFEGIRQTVEEAVDKVFAKRDRKKRLTGSKNPRLSRLFW